MVLSCLALVLALAGSLNGQQPAPTPIPARILVKGPTSLGVSAILDLEEARANGTNSAGLRAPADISASWRWILPATAGTTGQCLKVQATGSTVNGYVETQLETADCWPATTGWLTSQSSGTSQTHYSTVWATGVGDRVGWETRRARGTSGSPLAVTAGDWLSEVKYTGYNSTAGAFVPAVSETVKAQAVSGSGIDGVWSLQIHDVTNSFADVLVADKNRVESITFWPLVTNTYSLGEVSRKWSVVHATDLGASGSRISKLWVTDIDCSGTCPGGGGYFSKDGVGIYPTLNEGIDASRATGQFVKSRKMEVVSDGAAFEIGAFWDLRSKVDGLDHALYNNYLEMRDNSGTVAQKWARGSAASGTTSRSILDMDLHPDDNNTWKLGTSGKKWSTVYTGGLNGDGAAISVTQNLIPSASSTYSLGSATNLWNDIRVGLTYTGALLSIDTNPIILNSTLERRGGGGTVDVGTTSGRIDTGYFVNLNISGTCTGCPGAYWTRTGTLLEPSTAGDGISTSGDITGNDVYADRYLDYTTALRTGGSQVIDSSKNATFNNVTISGTCTGCPGGAVTDGGATTYVTATGDNFAVGTSSTSHKFEVSGGTSQFGGTIQPSFAGSYNIGSSSLYWNDIWASSIYGVGSIQVYQSGVVRAQMTGGSTSIVRVIDGSNVVQAEMRSNGSFYSGGSQGITASFDPNSCSSITVTGGIITAKSGC